MKQNNQNGKTVSKKSKKEKFKLYKPRKKKTGEEDAAIQYLQGQYDTVSHSLVILYRIPE